MDEAHLRDLFADDTYDKFRDVLLRVLEHAYEVASASHRMDAGFDALTFGVGVWRLSWHYADSDFTAAGFRVERPSNSLRIVAGPFYVYLYRAGAGGAFDIGNDLAFLTGTPTKASISESNQYQMELFEVAGSEEAEEPALTRLVVAHTGDPQAGLSGVWIGAPHIKDDVVRWAWVVQIFSTAPSELAVVPPSPPAPYGENDIQFVPFTEQTEPVVEFGEVVNSSSQDSGADHS